MGTGQTPRNSLTEEQENLAKKLHADYSHLGLSLDDIRAIIAQNPHLTEAQLRELLNKYGSVVQNYPKLVDAHGALAVFQAFIALAVYDPAHGGNYSTRKPAVLPDFDLGTTEAEAELGAMEEGLAPWPFTPSLDPRYEGIDANGQAWDVKSFRSIDTNGTPFSTKAALKKIQKDVDNNEKVILDDRQLTQKEIDALLETLKKAKLDKEVVWWPTTPTELTPSPTPTPDELTPTPNATTTP
jgi:hypothetical protein